MNSRRPMKSLPALALLVLAGLASSPRVSGAMQAAPDDASSYQHAASIAIRTQGHVGQDVWKLAEPHRAPQTSKDATDQPAATTSDEGVPVLPVRVVDPDGHGIAGFKVFKLVLHDDSGERSSSRAELTDAEGRTLISLEGLVDANGLLLEAIGGVGASVDFQLHRSSRPWGDRVEGLAWSDQRGPAFDELVIVSPPAGTVEVQLQPPLPTEGAWWTGAYIELHALVLEPEPKDESSWIHRVSRTVTIPPGASKLEIHGVPLDVVLVATVCLANSGIILGAAGAPPLRRTGETMMMSVPLLIDPLSFDEVNGITDPDEDVHLGLTRIRMSRRVDGEWLESFPQPILKHPEVQGLLAATKGVLRLYDYEAHTPTLWTEWFSIRVPSNTVREGDRLRFHPWVAEAPSPILVAPKPVNGEFSMGRVRFQQPGDAQGEGAPEGAATPPRMATLLEGRVVDDQGHPVEGASVRGRVRDPEQDWIWLDEVVADDQGHFALEARAELGAGDVRLLVRHPLHLTKHTSPVAGGGPPVVIELERGGALRFRVISDAWLDASALETTLIAQRSNRPALAGRRVNSFLGHHVVSHERLGTGRYTLEVRLGPAGDLLHRSVVEIDGLVEAPPIDLRGRLRTCLVRLEGPLDTPRAWHTVQVQSASGEPAIYPTISEGLIQFVAAGQPGDRRVQVLERDDVATTFTLPGSWFVVPERYDALEVQVIPTAE